MAVSQCNSSRCRVDGCVFCSRPALVSIDGRPCPLDSTTATHEHLVCRAPPRGAFTTASVSVVVVVDQLSSNGSEIQYNLPEVQTVEPGSVYAASPRAVEVSQPMLTISGTNFGVPPIPSSSEDGTGSGGMAKLA